MSQREGKRTCIKSGGGGDLSLQRGNWIILVNEKSTLW